jgi:hypothetical protein
VRDLVKRDLITLINIPSKKNAADILTKAKPHSVFKEDRDKLLCMTRPPDCLNWFLSLKYKLAKLWFSCNSFPTKIVDLNAFLYYFLSLFPIKRCGFLCLFTWFYHQGDHVEIAYVTTMFCEFSCFRPWPCGGCDDSRSSPLAYMHAWCMMLAGGFLPGLGRLVSFVL